MSRCGGALGTGGLGSLPWGSGTSLALSQAVQVALNAVDVTFLAAPKAVDPADVADALHPPNWTLEVREPFGSAERLVQHVERRSALVLRVFADGRFSFDAVYRITLATRVTTATGIPLFPGCSFLDFETFGEFQPAGVVLREEERTDLSNPQQLRDAEMVDPPPLGTFQLNDRGDIALERGRAYLRKRILRRAMTTMGGFFHLPSYGFSEPLKSKITPDVLRRMQARAQAQVLREPDVREATVTVSRQPGTASVVILTIRVIDREGSAETVTLPVDLSP